MSESKCFFLFKKFFIPIFIDILLVACGITLLALPPTDCPSGCSYVTCRYYSDYSYPCQCGNDRNSSNCAGYEKSPSKLYSGISSLTVGAVYTGFYFWFYFPGYLNEYREIGDGKVALTS